MYTNLCEFSCVLKSTSLFSVKDGINIDENEMNLIKRNTCQMSEEESVFIMKKIGDHPPLKKRILSFQALKDFYIIIIDEREILREILPYANNIMTPDLVHHKCVI